MFIIKTSLAEVFSHSHSTLAILPRKVGWDLGLGKFWLTSSRSRSVILHSSILSFGKGVLTDVGRPYIQRPPRMAAP